MDPQNASVLSENTEIATAAAPQADQSGLSNDSQVVEQSSPPETHDGVDHSVPYSRFHSVIEEKREAQRRAEELEERLVEIERRQQERQNSPSEFPDPSDPDWQQFATVWGNTPDTRQAYKIERQRQQRIVDMAEQRAVEAARKEYSRESERTDHNLDYINRTFEDFQQSIGRPLSEDEEISVLGILGEFSKKDRKGNIVSDLLPIDKAWEIHQMRAQNSMARVNRARSVPTALTNARSQGESISKSNRDPNFKPGEWGAWRKRFRDTDN